MAFLEHSKQFKFCITGPNSIAVVPGGSGSAPAGSCTDNHLRCQYWSHTNECQNNAQWMQQNCAGSCSPSGSCPLITVVINGQCQDDPSVTQCAQWASSGECQRNQDYMLWKCTSSCNLCQTGGSAAPGGPQQQSPAGGQSVPPQQGFGGQQPPVSGQSMGPQQGPDQSAGGQQPNSGDQSMGPQQGPDQSAGGQQPNSGDQSMGPQQGPADQSGGAPPIETD